MEKLVRNGSIRVGACPSKVDEGPGSCDLVRQNAELRAALEASDRGFFMANRDGAILGGTMGALSVWLGELSPGTPAWAYLSEGERAAACLEVSWQAVFENLLPLELTLAQLPARMKRGTRMLALTYRAILLGEDVEKLLVIVADTTAQHERELAEANQRELNLLFRRLVKDTGAVEEFFDEGFSLIETIESAASGSDLVVLKRSLHTMKGNAGFFGLERFAALAHAVESELAESGCPPAAGIAQLVSAWEEIALMVSPFLGSRCDMVDVSSADVDRLIRQASSGLTPAELVTRLEALRNESMDRRLGRLAQQLRAMAVELGKEVDVTTRSDGERWESGRFASFWSSVVHVLRNAVDHGIEPHDARVAACKPSRGVLALRVLETRDAQVFEVEDDGAGIDWLALRERARKLGVRVNELSDVDLLFLDGVSTRENVTTFSGRGVGLAVTRAACLDLGGTIAVESWRGKGTRFSFSFPKPEATIADSAPASSDRRSSAA